MRSHDDHSPDKHISDQDLLLAADGELAAKPAARVHAHLAACWGCRARMAEIEGTIADFARAHHQAVDPHLPPIDGPRALLRAQLAELASRPEPASWRSFFQFNAFPFNAGLSSSARAIAFVVVALFIAAFAARILSRDSTVNSTASTFERGAVPNNGLTPGATRRVTISDVCVNPREEVIGDVSDSLRQQVFQEYGIPNARAADYEIDYLITPGLGGVEEIHNLWPEPNRSPTWNAHVKDALEEHLHEMVCAGKLDLPTAQKDIATNWIAAYKKYFHTDRPLALRSGL